jgi:uncharacterized repeat protein (TIGR01451 family)
MVLPIAGLVVAAAISLGVATATAQEITVAMPAASPQSARVAVLIELQEQPGARAYADVLAQAATRDAQVRAAAVSAGRLAIDRTAMQQAQVGAAVHARFAVQEIFRVQKAMNAIAATVDVADLAAIARLPGVKAVHRIALEYPSNATSVPFIGTPPVWSGTATGFSVTGSGVRIGIIDSGIDYQHADFGGAGLLADYQANDRTVAPDAFFPTSKVAGGTDFAGDAYNGTNGPVPDADPMDCEGHGTHVAGTAAGYGVTAAGSTFTGPYDASVPFGSLRIGPGVAPQATLYAIRVFGCSGGTGLTVQGIDWAMDPNGDNDLSDHLDVINLSLGPAFGGLTDTTAIAADNAAAAGVIVVTAAGNDGDTYFIAGAPGVARRTITTAAALDPGVNLAAVRVNSPAPIAGDYLALPASFAPAPAGTTANVVQALDPADGAGPLTTDGCSALTNAAAIAGNIALIDRGTCAYTTKALNAQNAGAIGVIVINNVADLTAPTGTSGTPITIPLVLVSQGDGVVLKANLGGPLNVSLVTTSGGDTLASFTSRGPTSRTSPAQLKPDLAAPGQSIASAQTGITCTTGVACLTPTASGFDAGSVALTISGTSMASAHVTGVMALLRQVHPDWTVEELKALVMNAALHDITVAPNGSGARYSAARVGAGRVDATLAAQSPVVAFNDDGTGVVSLSFDGAVVGTAHRTKTLRLVNHGTTDQAYTLAIDTAVDAPGVSYALPGGTSIVVPAGQSITLDVTMDADASQMRHTRDTTVTSTQTAPAPLTSLGSLARHWLTEESSYLVLKQGGTPALRIPLYTVAQPTSAMTASTTIVTGGAPTGATTLSLSGSDICTGTLGAGPVCSGTFPTDEVSLVTPFELQVVSPPNPSAAPPWADIQYAGVAYSTASNLLMFGVSTFAPWSSPNDTIFNIYIDNNSDGTWDRVLFATDSGTAAKYLFGTTTAGPQDAFITFVFNIATSGVSTQQFLNRISAAGIDSRVFNNQVEFLAATPASLGITGTSFRWKVVTCPATEPLCGPLGGSIYDEAAGPYFWNRAAQGLDFGGTNLAQDLNGASLPVTWNTANMTTNGTLGALLLHHHNGVGDRAQVVTLDTNPAISDLGLTLTSSSPAPGIGQQATLTLTATNNGPSPTTGIVVSTSLLTGVDYVSDDGGGAYDVGQELWTVGSLANGASATLHLVVTAKNSEPLTMSAQIASSTTLDPITTNNHASLGLTPPASADLQITAIATTPSVKAGSPGSFTITVRNNGGDTAYNVTVANLLGSSTLISGTPSTGVFDVGTGAWHLASLGKGVSATLTLGAIVTSGPLATAQATGSAAVSDPLSTNNQATASITVLTRQTSIASALSVDPPILGGGTIITATVTDIDATGTASAPAGIVHVTSSVAGDQLSSPTCVLTPVPSTASASCQVTLTPGAPGADSITLTYDGSVIHTGATTTAGVTVQAMPTTVTAVDAALPYRDEAQTVRLSATVTSASPIAGGTITFTLRTSGNTVVGTPVVSPVLGGSGAATITYIVPVGVASQALTIDAAYSGTTTLASGSDTTHHLTIAPPAFTYLLAEGATGSFFQTDILIANPNSTPAPVTLTFLKDDGTTVVDTRTVPATSRATIHASSIAGLESASFSTRVVSTSQLPLVVERTMSWDHSGYGAHSEKATEAPAWDWYFAEGSQGFFHTYFLLANPQTSANVAHVTYVMEDASTLQRDYAIAAQARLTIDAAADAALLDRSFGATVSFDQPGMAERAMYFGASPLFTGGDVSAGSTAPAPLWYLAEGATGSFFNTYVLVANPNAVPAVATLTYLLDSGMTVTKTHTVAAQQRLTIDVSAEDPLLASAAFATTVTADAPVVVERTQYWPGPGGLSWYESHNSAGVMAAGEKWGLAEGEVGGAHHAQTYILVSNPGTQPADLTVTFLRTDGTTVTKHFTVAATSRYNIAVTAGGGSAPELQDEPFATVIESTQPIVVERSLYLDANGITWAAGTNSTATRLH